MSSPRAAEAILVALNELNSNGEIRTACRSAFSRLLERPGCWPFFPSCRSGSSGLLVSEL